MQLWIDMSDKGLLFTHTPQHPSTLAESHRFGDKPLLNVHGHIHTNPSPDGPFKCVSVEQINFTPVDIEDLV
jgi:calcineurin-like phosphoesterase family protein